MEKDLPDEEVANILPDYDLDKAMTSDKVVLVDSHCHVDFIFKRLYPPKLSSFTELRRKFRTTFPRGLTAIVTVFCQPEKWMRVMADNVVKL